MSSGRSYHHYFSIIFVFFRSTRLTKNNDFGHLNIYLHNLACSSGFLDTLDVLMLFGSNLPSNAYFGLLNILEERKLKLGHVEIQNSGPPKYPRLSGSHVPDLSPRSLLRCQETEETDERPSSAHGRLLTDQWLSCVQKILSCLAVGQSNKKDRKLKASWFTT